VVRRGKLLQPRLPVDAVERPRLLALLDRRPDALLVLLSGPGGAGKTTLLGQWLAAREPPAAWLTMDDRDDAASLVVHLVAALRPRFPDAGRATLGLLRLPGQVAPADLGAALAEDLATLEDEAVVVLDDYQEVRDAGVHAALEALLRHPPPRLRLVLATRVDPPLPLARLRAGGQLVEIRAADLRFAPDEAAAFLARVLPAPFSPELAEALAGGTEGWAAGLRLAATALQGLPGPGGLQGPPPAADALAAVAGRGQALATEYLLDEVFARQPPGLQDFLLRTAVAERLCAPLCEALLAPGGAPYARHDGVAAAPAPGVGGAAGQEALAAVLRANLFLTPLDEAPVVPAGPAAANGRPAGGVAWYRYHPLLRDLLLRLLPEYLGPGAGAALHARAGAWFAAAGLVEEGVHHLLAAGDAPAAAALVERHVFALLEEEWPAVERWLGLLPSEVVQGRPALLVARAKLAQRRGRFDALPTLVAAAQAALDADHAGLGNPEGQDRPAGASAPEPPDSAALAGELASLTAFRCFVVGDPQGALAAAERALALLPEGAYQPRGGVIGTAAPAALAVHGVDAVLRRLEALPAAPTGGGTAAPAWALPGIGHALLLAGRHREAAGAGRALLELGAPPGPAIARCWGHLLLGAVHYEWDRPQEAERYLGAALEARDGVRLMPLREGTFGLALALQAQGRAGEADAVLDQLADALLRTANAGELARVGAFRVRLALLRGELAPARRWLPSAGDLPAHWLDTVLDCPPLTRAWARLRLAPEAPSPEAALAAALADVDALLAETEGLHLVTRQAQALALRALAQHALGETAAALDSLAQALDLAEAGGLVRTFADLGPPLAGLLGLLVARRPLSPYHQRVRAACGGAARGAPAEAPMEPREPPERLVEPLSGRELEVLDRLRRQWLNKEIAEDLCVSTETVKTHTANIYAKLGVGDRRRAVRRAAELGLLPLP
jgi:LuxR family maltose regulon positive regulatory protein